MGRTKEMASILVAEGNLALQDYPFIHDNFTGGDDLRLCGSPFNGCLNYLSKTVHRLVLYQILPFEVNQFYRRIGSAGY